MEKFVKHLQPAVVDNQIFGCVATGFGDTLPAMREQTLKVGFEILPNSILYSRNFYLELQAL